MRHKVHSEALRVAAAVVEEHRLHCEGAERCRIMQPMWGTPQQGFRVRLGDGRGRLAWVTVRRPARGGPLCDVKVSTKHGEWEMTMLPTAAGDGETFNEDHACDYVAERFAKRK